MSDKLLVTGASGHLGQRVLAHLLDTLKVPASRIVAGTRKPESLAAFAAKGVEVRALDFEKPETLAAAFKGVDRALVISTDALDRPGRRYEQHSAAIKAAEAAGVKHVLYTSMPDPAASLVMIAPDHDKTEKALAASKLSGWTVLRNHWYMENLLMGVPQALAGGQWYTAAGEGRIAYISRDDLGRAAATALAGNDNGKNTYTLSGAQAFTTAELAQAISAAVNKPLAVVQVPVEGLIEGMVGAGLPQPVAAIFASFDTNTAAGGVAKVTGDYKKITGSEPQSFSAWLQANKGAFGA